ncbi:MAG: methyltransferase domain-containing protein [Planctomycetia bacterium]
MSDVLGHAIGAGPPEPRFAAVRRAMHPGSLGIEIGPFLHPLAAKRDGYRTLIVDRYDSSTLRDKARERGAKPDEIERIETVDFVGDASHLLELVRGEGFTGRVDWIVSSHNFEHLPDPLRFLRDCEALLEPRGALAMIVPDKRCCFDRFQPAATLAGMIEAAEQIPTPASEAWAAFRQASGTASLVRGGAPVLSWGLAEGDSELMLMGDPRPPHGRLERQRERGRDPDFSGHRWRYTPAVLEAILFDLHVLGLVGLEVDEMTPTVQGDFTVWLRASPPCERTAEEIRRRRTDLRIRAEDEAAVVSRAYRALEAELAATRAELARLGARAA